MKIVKYGTVVISSGPIQVEGFIGEPEASDPAEVPPEQLLLACVIDWAKTRFQAAVNAAVMNAINTRRANAKSPENDA